MPPRETPGGRARAGRHPLLKGGLAAVGMASVYAVLVTLAQGSWRDALVLFAQDLPLTAPIALGFGAQVALYVRLRGLEKSGGRIVAASGGASAASMAACCAHRVADLLPLVGVSAAASLLAAYRTPLLAIGIAANAAGIAIMVRRAIAAKRRLRVT